MDGPVPDAEWARDMVWSLFLLLAAHYGGMRFLPGGAPPLARGPAARQGEILGTVEAPDAEAAKAVAAVQFNLDEVRRRGCRTCSLAQRLGVSRGCPKTNDPFEVPGSRFMACLAA